MDEVIRCNWIPWSMGGNRANQVENQTCVSAANVSLFSTSQRFR